jgi:rod shape determining protein RodA
MLALFIPVGILIGLSLVVLSSIGTKFFMLQAIWALLGVAVTYFFYVVDWRTFLHYRWLVVGLYGLTILLLLAVALTGPLIRQTHSWLVLGPLSFQPVELAKISLIFVYARYFSRRHLGIAHLKHIATSFLYFAIPAGLVMLQPDLGSTLVLFGIWVGFLLVSGLPLRRLLAGFVLLALAGIFLWFYGFKAYQRERIIGVFYPEKDVLGVNYSVHQAKIAIGSAGFLGKGYHQGSQIQLGFLTEPEGDFVLAALIEEWGLLGGMVLIGAFLFLIFQILKIGSRAEYNFEKFVCLGTVLVFGVHFFLNAGSTTGLSPVVGVTFPFMSYGGSSLLTDMTLVAIISAISRHSYK